MLDQEQQIQIKRYPIDKEIAHFALVGLNREQAKEGRILIQAIVNDWLARQVVKRGQTHRAAKMEANMMAAEVRKLLEEAKKVQDPSVKRRLLRYLADAGLECLYVLNGAAGAMSRRLNRSSQTRTA